MQTHRKGIHHISVLAGDPQQNADFYVNTLGMRMIKKSVNQDDPGTYHLFYGNPAATSGSSLTFFPFPNAVEGQSGTGEAVTISFLVPSGALEFWKERLKSHKVPYGEPYDLFGNTTLPFEDPDGLSLEFVFKDVNIPAIKSSSWRGPVQEDNLIHGFHGTTLKLTEEKSTAQILEDILGFKKTETKGNLSLFKTDAEIGNTLIIETSEQQAGKRGKNTIHHVAFRAEDENELNELRWKVAKLGLSPTQIIDRHWFKSVYFQTPGGVLFEMATEGPGYTVDEREEHLGEKLVLPPWLEPKREQIENRLPAIDG